MKHTITSFDEKNNTFTLSGGNHYYILKPYETMKITKEDIGKEISVGSILWDGLQNPSKISINKNIKE